MAIAFVVVIALICFVGLHLLDRQVWHIFYDGDKTDLKLTASLVSDSNKIVQEEETVKKEDSNIYQNNKSPTLEPSSLRLASSTLSPVVLINSSTPTTTNKNNDKEIISNISTTTTSHREVTESNKNKKCQVYENKTLIDPENMYDRNITLLVSFPGSGNTWTRVLIETITGAYTGSVYLNDNDLSHIFYTEVRCGLRMAAIKGHPTNFDRCGDYLCLARGKYEVRKCRKGMIYNWKRFIFIARDPMKSIFSEYQRLSSGKHDGLVEVVTDSKIKNFINWANVLADDIQHDWEEKIYPMKQLHDPIDFLTIKYENLLDKNKREDEIRPVAKFLKFPYEPDRIPCAFELSEKPSGIHRKSTLTYHSLIGENHTLACQLWSKIKSFSGNFSYPNPFKKFKCD